MRLLNYPGSKWGMAEEIVAMLPPHRTYLEPYFGSGAVFFTKAPSPIEIINDLDGDVANLFRVIRWAGDMLAERVELTPYSREVFDDAWEDHGHDPVDEAARFLIRSKMGFGYKCHTKTGFKIDLTGREAGYAVREWNSVPQAIRDVAKRLKDAYVENRPALDLIRKCNDPKAAIYCDPPYLMETRGGKQYNHEMSKQDHEELLHELLRILQPGRVAAIHVKDRVLFGNVTGYGMPSMEPFHAMCIQHYMKHGFVYFGMITVVTDVVRENNQTYRLGWTEQCKVGTKMGVGCPEYILLFRKLPTDRSKAYADVRVVKSKEEYPLSQWQLDAHAYWRSSGDRLLNPDELARLKMGDRMRRFHEYSRGHVYDYDAHVALSVALENRQAISREFMTLAPASPTHPDIWDDVNRMKTLNTTQSQRRKQLHVCPLQLDIVERIINRYSNPGDLVLDPFGGLGTVAMMALRMKRKGYTIELNPDYFRDAVGYLRAEEVEVEQPSLFDLLEQEA